MRLYRRSKRAWQWGNEPLFSNWLGSLYRGLLLVLFAAVIVAEGAGGAFLEWGVVLFLLSVLAVVPALLLVAWRCLRLFTKR